MKKIIFDVLTAGFGIFENPIYDYITMSIIGILAFTIAWNVVGTLGFRGELGSVTHWIVRIFAFIAIWFIFGIIIKIVFFCIENWINILVIGILIIIFSILKYISSNNKNSILNKKIL